MKRIKLAIMTPIFWPATGGAATYYAILTKALIRFNGIDSIHIFTEKATGCDRLQTPGGITIHRIFPERAGKDRQGLRFYTDYIVQNLYYFKLFRHLKAAHFDAAIIHSSFHNYPSLIYMAMMLSRLHRSTILISDIRDRLLPKNRFWQLRPYNHLIACCENVYQHILGDKRLRPHIRRIPVPMEPPNGLMCCSPIIKGHNLGKIQYILYIGQISKRKGTLNLVKGFEQIRGEFPDLKLVLIGMNKASRMQLRSILNVNGVIWLGSCARSEVYAAMRHAKLIINPSSNEGMPRSSLEALLICHNVLLPPNVPEFMFHCPRNTLRDNRPDTIAAKIRECVHNPEKCNYPLADHQIIKGAKLYLDLLRDT